MKRYYDYEHDQIVHEEELRKEYEEMDNQDNVTFEQYIENCQAHNGGTLMFVQGMDKNGNLTDNNVPATGWLQRDLAFILTREQMYEVYTEVLKIAEYDSFMSFLDEVVSDGTYRRVI